MSRPLLETRGVYKRFGRRVVLRDVSIAISPGESVAVFGANGAGKSTLLRILSTLARPTRGEFLAFGEPAWEIRDDVRARVGVVGHQPYVYPELTCRENLRFFATMFDLDPAKVVELALRTVGLESRGDSRASTLSRGLQQRLNVARATLHQPDVLILDEPDTGLDLAGRDLLTSIIETQVARNGTAIFTTHAHDFGLGLATRIVVLNEGSVVHDGPATCIRVEELERIVAARHDAVEVRS